MSKNYKSGEDHRKLINREEHSFNEVQNIIDVEHKDNAYGNDQKNKIRSLILTLLTNTDIDVKIKEYFLTDSSIDKFVLCFITPLKAYNINKNISSSTVKNYELLEFNGDRIINNILSEWSRKTYNNITNLGWLDQMNKHLKSSLCLSNIGRKMGVDKLIQKGYTRIGEKNIPQHISDSIIDDVVEALMGCFVVVAQDYDLFFGIGMQIAYDILKVYLDNYAKEFPLDSIETLWSNSDLLREFYDILGWPAGFIINIKDNIVTCEYYMWDKISLQKIMSIKNFNESYIHELLSLEFLNPNDRSLIIETDKLGQNTDTIKPYLPMALNEVYLYTTAGMTRGKSSAYIEYHSLPVENSEIVVVSLSKAIVFLANTILYKQGKKFSYISNSRAEGDFKYYFGDGEKIGESKITIQGGNKAKAIDEAKNIAVKSAMFKLQEKGYELTTFDKKRTYEYSRKEYIKAKKY